MARKMPSKARKAIAKAAARAAREIASIDNAPPPPPSPEEQEPIANAPATPIRSGEAAQAPSQALIDLGPPPSDLLEQQEWFYKVLMTSAHDTLIDDQISNKERRRELRSIGASAAALFPDAVRAEAVRFIKEDQDRLKARSKAKGGAKLEPAKPKPASAELEAEPEPGVAVQ